MSDGRRSFWSSIPGLITGLAGLLTGVVGLGTLAVQQGIIGGKDSAATTTTAVGATPAGGPTTTAAEAASFSVDVSRIQFQAGDRQKKVKVTNPTRTATVTMQAPTFQGSEPSVFSADNGCTKKQLGPKEDCTVTITFAPAGLLKAYTATLVLAASEVTAATEVPIQTAVL